MKIQIISNLFRPDELAGAALFTDLAFFLKLQGHDVRVTTTFPYYPAWRLRPEDKGVKCRDESLDGIIVRRVGMFVPERPNGARRVASDLTFFINLLRYGEFKDWTPEVVLTASPMFSQCLVQRFLYRGQKIPRLIVVQDFVVDAALELKILWLPGLAATLRQIERWSFLSASTLFTISRPMLQKLEGKLDAKRRCLFVPNWIHQSLEDEVTRQKDIPILRQPSSLFYSGNFGVKQGLPSFVESFSHYSGDWSVRMHGGGSEAGNLRRQIERCKSITLGGVLDEADYVRSLRSATACLVTQQPGIGANFLPSKILPALATGTPILAIGDATSPLGLEVRDGGFGAVVEPGNDRQLADTLDAWTADPGLLREMGRRSLVRSKLYAWDTILPIYERELLALAAGG